MRSAGQQREPTPSRRKVRGRVPEKRRVAHVSQTVAPTRRGDRFPATCAPSTHRGCTPREPCHPPDPAVHEVDEVRKVSKVSIMAFNSVLQSREAAHAKAPIAREPGEEEFENVVSSRSRRTLSVLALLVVSARRPFLLPAGTVLRFHLRALVGGLTEAPARRVPVCPLISASTFATLAPGGLGEAARGHAISRVP